MKHISNKILAIAVLAISPLFTTLYFILGALGCDIETCAMGLIVSMLMMGPITVIYDLIQVLDEEEA